MGQWSNPPSFSILLLFLPSAADAVSSHLCVNIRDLWAAVYEDDGGGGLCVLNMAVGMEQVGTGGKGVEMIFNKGRPGF